MSLSIASEIPQKVMLSPDKSALAMQTLQHFAGPPSDVDLFRAPTFAEIEERQRANAAARALVKLEK